VTTTDVENYSTPQGTTIVAGNLQAGGNAITFTDSVVVSAGTNVGSDGDTVTFASSATQTLQAASGARLVNLSHTGSGTLRLTGGLTVTGSFTNVAGTFDANDRAVTVSGLAELAGGTYRAGTTPQNFSGGLVVAGGILTSSTGPMTINGAVAVLDGGLVRGAGTASSLTAIGGTVAPGDTGPGILTVLGAATFFSTTTISVRLDGLTPGSEYSQLIAGGPVNLGGSTLHLDLGFEPPVGSSFEILTAAGGISGTFSGLDDGATFTQDGITFQITYHGGPDGNSVVLTRLS
jgi:hypothetical protein